MSDIEDLDENDSVGDDNSSYDGSNDEFNEVVGSGIPIVKINEYEGALNDDDEDPVDDDDKIIVGGADETLALDYDIAAGANSDNNDDEDSDEEDESYLQKFNTEINKNYIVDFHPECMIHNYDEISAMSKVIRDDNNNVIDDLHRSIPYLTKYEKARVLGQRAKQINSGAKAFVKIPDNVIDGYLVAEIELIHKRIPFIIRRPFSGGGCEYWNLKDLEIIGF
jgi:DNA-directed RNA polymerase I, II, and III subunit RPABC2